MTFTVIWSKRAKKQLANLEKKEAERIILKAVAVSSLEPLLIQKVKGRDFFKIRSGDYRVFADKHVSTKRIIVHSVWHRKKAYKNI